MANNLPDRDKLLQKAEKSVSQLDANSLKNQELHKRLAKISTDAQARSDALKLSGYDHWHALARNAARLEDTLKKYKDGKYKPKPGNKLYSEIGDFKTAVEDAVRAPE